MSWLLSSLLSFSPAIPVVEPARVERRVPMMGTLLELEVEARDRATALAASEVAVRALEEAEARLSTWRPESELSRLNRAAAGRPVALSPQLAAELAAARRCYDATGGAFDPAIGRLLDAWGVRESGRVPAPAALRAALVPGGLAALDLGPEGMAVRRHPLLRIEEGAFGKGAALDRATAALDGGPGPVRAFLDLGGQVKGMGPGTWTVAMADPRHRHRPVITLEIEAVSVATSGASERSFEVAGRRFSHLLDPRTGEPVPDFGSVTVVAGDGLTADCLSTGLYVLGAEEALRRGARWAGVEVVVMEPHGPGLRVRATSGLAGRLGVLDPGVTLELVELEEAGPRRGP